MGDPKKQRKKFFKPSHPWQKARLDEEAVIIKDYALKNKKELWKMQSKLKHHTSQAKKLVTLRTKQMEQERILLLSSLKQLGIIKENATIDDILGLNLRDIMERRLQTLVHRKGLAKTMKQARQFIVHKHIVVNGKVLSVPSYIVPLDEEDKITFAANSSLNNTHHPERAIEKKPKKAKAKSEKSKSKKEPEKKLEKKREVSKNEGN